MTGAAWLLGQAGVRPAASEEDIANASARLPRSLPGDYQQFLLHNNGFEGEVGDSWLHLWVIDQLMKMNDRTGSDELPGGVILIGSNGASEGYGYAWHGARYSYVGMPMICTDVDEVVVLGDSFDELIERVRRTPPPWT